MLHECLAPNDVFCPWVSGRRLVSSICDMHQALKDFGTPGAATPRAIKSAMDSKTVKFLGFQQRDAHEFLGDLLDQIHEEIETPTDCPSESKVETGGEDQEDSLEVKNPVEAEPIKSTKQVKEVLPTDENFLLTLQVCLKCNSCGYER
jgi:ubiquitin C-terminal hydrolase